MAIPSKPKKKTYAGYAKENEPYSGAVYIYHAVLPEEDSNGKPIELADTEVEIRRFMWF